MEGSQIKASITFKINNPNFYSIKLKQSDFEIFLDNDKLGSARMLEDLKIIKKKEGEYTLNLALQESELKSSIIPLLIDVMKNNKKININFPSNKNDFIFIDDVVSIINKFIIKNYSSGIYNVGTGQGTSIYTLLKIIDNAVNGNDILSKKYLNEVDLKKSNQNFFACTKKLKKYLNNFSFTNIDSGIQKVIKYI
jgi:hypothetical protein